jgi:hypothetical protein
MQGLRIEEIKITKTDPPVDETATESDSGQIH